METYTRHYADGTSKQFRRIRKSKSRGMIKVLVRIPPEHLAVMEYIKAQTGGVVGINEQIRDAIRSSLCGLVPQRSNMPKNKIVQAATMKLEVELRCSECNSPLIVNNTWSDIHGLSCYVEPCEECMSRRTKRALGSAAPCPDCGSKKLGIHSIKCSRYRPPSK